MADQRLDLGNLEIAAKAITLAADDYKIVIEKSTVPRGTAEHLKDIVSP